MENDPVILLLIGEFNDFNGKNPYSIYETSNLIGLKI